MDKLRITFTNGSLSSDLNDIVEKCKEFGESQELNDLNFQDGQPLLANDLNIIIRFLNSLLPNDKKLTEFDCEQQLCINQLDDIVNSINKLIINENNSNIYELIIEPKSSLHISSEGGQCLFETTVLKNGIPWNNNINIYNYNNTYNNNGYYRNFVLNISKNESENIREIPITFSFSSEEIEEPIIKTIILYQEAEENNTQEESNQEDVYKIKIQDDGRILSWTRQENFPIIVQVTKNGIPVSDRNEFFFRFVGDLSIDYIKLNYYEYKDNLYYFYYNIDANTSDQQRTFYFEGYYKNSSDRIEKKQEKRINILTPPNIGIDAYTYHPNLNSDETEIIIHGNALLDGEYQEEVIFNTIDFNGELLWQKHLSNGSNVASLYIPPNTSTDDRQFSVTAEYTYNGTTYVSSPVIFTQQGISVSEDENYYIIQWRCNLENATINNNNSNVIQLEEGENWLGTIYCPEGYSIEKITDNGNEINISNYINIINIQENHNFIVTLSQTEFIETLTVIPSSLNIKVGQTVNFVISSNSYQQAYNYAKLKFSGSKEPFYSLRVEGNVMNILETDEGIDVADSRNIKKVGYFIAPYENLNAYTSIPNEINYSLKAIGEGQIKLSFISFYGPDDYIGAITQCTINVSEADSDYRLVLHPNVIELNINGDPGQVRATLIGHKLGQPNWTLIQDNYETSIELEDFNCIVYPADVIGTREKEFIAVKNGKEYKATLIVVTRDWELTETPD